METPPVPNQDLPVLAVPDAPAVPRQRIEAIDMLRGVAILGILVVNIYAYGLPAAAMSQLDLWGEGTLADRLTLAFTTVFANLKFLSMLAILFGVGMWMQTNPDTKDQKAVSSLYSRRTMLLLCIGLFHALLFWWGDILVLYSLSALLVYHFRKIAVQKLKVMVVILYLVPILCCLGPAAVLMNFVEDLGRAYSGGGGFGHMQERPSKFEDAIPHVTGDPFADLQKAWTMQGDPAALAINAYYYAEGSWAQIFIIRLVDWIVVLCSTMLTFLPTVLALMTAGVLLARFRVLEEPNEHRDLLKIFIRVGLLVGLPLGILAALAGASGTASGQVYWALCISIGAPLQALAYLSLLLLWYHRPGMEWLKRSLTACGRMAMTNYLMHTLVFTTFFYGWGFGMFGRFGHAQLILFVIPMWAFQLWFSPWWLARYEFGPLEWLWRWRTYGKRPAFRRVTA